MMNRQTAQNIIKKAFAFADATDVFFTFQGGEPLLAGITFFEDFVEDIKQLNTKNSKVTVCVQTNATLIDDEWCSFFKKNNILVGVSLDGDEELNAYRKYPDGKSSFSDVMHSVELLKSHGVTFNILSVLTSRLAQSYRQAYRFFKQNDLHYLQFIPCLTPFDAEKTPYSMTNDDYANYLSGCYKLYFNDNMRGNLVSVRQFDNYSLIASGKGAEQCGMNGPCSTQFVVEGDGSVYPCDFYCTDEWLLGNINDGDFFEFYNSRKSVEFVKESFMMKEECKTCDYFTLCRGGGCKRNRASFDFCEAYKSFFSSFTDKIVEMA